MRHFVRWGLGFVLVGVVKLASFAATEPTAPKQPHWLLGRFLAMSEQAPEHLLHIADQLFSDDRLRMVSIEPRFAFEWQHRLAMVGALSALFDPDAKKIDASLRVHARKILVHALAHDPSLLVRDGVVESLRRIVRMQPGERLVWKAALERAFLDPKNFIDGEGLFIRETILTLMHEASLRPSRKVAAAAARDKNDQVRGLLGAWHTQAYDEM